jgi:hypothetical protein
MLTMTSGGKGIVGTIILAFTLHFGTTGSIIQMIDLRAIASHAAATDPEMLALFLMYVSVTNLDRHLQKRLTASSVLKRTRSDEPNSQKFRGKNG